LVPDNELFVCGDERCNENPGLTALQTIFLREHNRLADKFAREHPDWDSERIFQTARKWVCGVSIFHLKRPPIVLSFFVSITLISSHLFTLMLKVFV
jgi:hypothetical protein